MEIELKTKLSISQAVINFSDYVGGSWIDFQCELIPLNDTNIKCHKSVTFGMRIPDELEDLIKKELEKQAAITIKGR